MRLLGPALLALVLFGCSRELRADPPATEGDAREAPPASAADEPPAAPGVPAELVGRWRASGNVPMSWFKEYELRPDGTFSMQGYPPIHVTGRWAVSERDGDARFLLRVHEQQMSSGPGGEASPVPDIVHRAELRDGSLTWRNETYARQ